MFKKTMTFDNLEGEEVTQTFYFNYTKKEVMELIELKDLENKFKLLSTPIEESGLTNQQNNQQAYDVFEGLILDAYGQKGADNVTFVKNEQTREYFRNHVAFSDLVFEFIADPKLMGSFIEACLPPKLVAEAKESLAKEAKGEIKGATLAEMVEEAERRQKDPETRIEPGLENAPAHIQEHAQAISVPDEGPIPVAPTETVITREEAEAKKPEDLTADDIFVLSDEAFGKLDPRRLRQSAMVAAFQRKSAS